MSVTPRTPDSVKVIQVIEVIALRGAGIKGDMVRFVTQYWSFSGELLAETDPGAAIAKMGSLAPEGAR